MYTASSLVSYGYAVDLFQKTTFVGLSSFIFAIHVNHSFTFSS